MSTFTIRGCDEQLTNALHEASRQRGLSINRLVLEALENTFGQAGKKHRYEDLSHLAGTWSDRDIEEFDKATKVFELVDLKDWT